MAVTREEVLRVAHLARLRLTPEEVEQFTGQLNGILDHIEALAAVDVGEVEAIGGATEWSAPLREESEAADRLEREPADFAPDWRDGFYVVPRLAAHDEAELEEPFEDKASAPAEERPAPESGKRGEP